MVDVERDEDELWVVDQALRSPGVAAVWLWRDELAARDGLYRQLYEMQSLLLAR